MITVILPAFNEEGNIMPLIEKSVRAFEKNDYAGEILLINDGSTDGTKEEAERAAGIYPGVNVINHRRNLGLTEALMSGFERASGDIVLFLCADLQSDPEEDIPKLVRKIQEGYDVVLGWRQGRRRRLFVSKIYHILSRLLFRLSVHDLNWIKAFRKEVISELKLRSNWHRYIAHIAASRGYRVTEVKTNYYPRIHGQSKFGGGRVVAGFLDLINVKFHLSFSRRPMFFFGSVGLVFLFSGVILGLGSILYALTALAGTDRSLPKGLYFILTLLFLSGIQFIFFGFLAELVLTILEQKDIKR